jgi:internalin A
VKLEEIDLFNNEIREIKGLDNLRNLKRINLSRNEISDVKGINHLKKLEYLNIRGNKINEPEKYEYEYFFKYF